MRINIPFFAKIKSLFSKEHSTSQNQAQETPAEKFSDGSETNNHPVKRFGRDQPLVFVLIILFGLFALAYLYQSVQKFILSLTLGQGLWLLGLAIIIIFLLYFKRQWVRRKITLQKSRYPLIAAHTISGFHRGSVIGHLWMTDFLSAPPRRKWQIVRLPALCVLAIYLVVVFGHFFIPPKIMVSFPGNNSQEAPLNGRIEIIFDRGMIKQLAQSNFSITPRVDGTFSWEGNQKLIFTPSRPLARGARYKVAFNGITPSSFFVPLLLKNNFSFETIGNPRVVIASPRKQALEGLAPVTVVFDRAMIPLTTATNKADKQPAFIISPAVTGEGRWLGTTAYQFRPTTRYRRGTTYTVTIPKGMRSVDGGILKDGHSWSFSSELPRQIDLSPKRDERFSSHTGSVAAWFNQPINPQSVLGKLQVYDEKKNLVPGKIVVTDNVLAFYSETPLERKVSYSAKLLKGIEGTEGENGSDEEAEWNFTIAPKPKILSTTPSNNAKDVGESYRIEVKFASPMNNDSFDGNVQINPVPSQKPEVFFSTYENKLSISTYLGRSQKYTVTIGGNVKDQYGVPLGQPYTLSFTTSAYKPAISIYPNGTYFASFNQQVVPRIVSQVVNVKKVEYSLYKLEKDDLLELYKRRYGNSGCPDYQCSNWQNYKTDGLQKVRVWTETFDADFNTPVHVVTKVTKQDGGLLSSGFYFLDAKIPQGAHDNMVMIVSKTTMTIKMSKDQIFAWAVEQKSTDTVAGMAMELTDDKGNKLTSGSTNSDGVFMKSVNLRDKYNLLLFGEKGDDVVVAATSWNQGIGQYDFGLPSYYSSNQYDAYGEKQTYKQYITIDRPVYRPGQTVYFKGLVRKDNDAAYESVTPGEKVSVTVREEQGREIYSKDLVLDTFGSYSDKLVLSPDGSLGFYTVTARFGSNTYSQQFQVEEYRKPEYAVAIIPNKPAYTQGETASVVLKASYYFGAPVVNAPVNWSVQSSAYNFRWDKDTNFEFGDPDAYWSWAWGYPQSGNNNNGTLTEGSGRTNGKGELTFSIPLDIREKQTGQQMTVEGIVNDLSNQSIAGSDIFTVNKGGLYVGLKPSSYSNTAGEKAQVEIVVLDLKQNTVVNTPVDLNFYKRTWETVREQNPDDGVFYYTSKSIDTLVESTSVTTDSLGRAIGSFTPKEGGTYKVIGKVVDKDGNTNTSGTYLWVSGFGFEAPRQNHDRIVLVTDKKEYFVDDTISLFVATPFASSAAKTLITAERANVVDYKIVTTSQDKNNFPLKAISRYAPNVFLSAVLVKGGDGVKNPAEFKIGYAEVKVTDKAHKIEVGIKTDKKRYRPRETMKATIETNDLAGRPLSAQLAFGVIDQAVFDLGGNVSIPEIYQTFYQPRNLGVNTSALLTISLDRINANINLGSKGGSGGGCFTGDTLILMRGGVYKKIKDVKKGDVILTKKTDTSAVLVEARVIGTEKKTVDDYLILNGTLRVTKVHRLFVNNSWVTAQHIEVGDILLDRNSHPVRVFSKETMYGKTEVYNLEVETYRTFIAGDVYVHNEKGLNDTSRYDFPDTAYWNPSLTTGNDGKLQLSIPLPDSLTTWRLSAVANTAKEAFGSAVNSIIVTRDVLIRPLLPRFLAIGDQPILGGIIVNTTDTDETFKVKITATNIVISDPLTKEVSVPAGQQVKVLWHATAGNAKEGKITLSVSGEDGVTRDQVAQVLPIKSYSTPETVATSGQAKDSVAEKIFLPKTVSSSQGSAEFTLSPVLGSAAFTSMSYLADYPYYCGEQVVSKFLPAISIHELFSNAEITESGPISLKKLDASVDDGLQRLNNSQHADGGWGWWVEGQSDPFITAYSYLSLLEAKDNGFTVDKRMLSRANTYLRSNLSSGKYVSLNTEAFIIYVLRDDGNDLSSYASNLYTRRFELSIQARAYLTIAMRKFPGMGSEAMSLYHELISLAKKTATTTHWEESGRDYQFMTSNATTTATVLEALTEIEKSSSLIPEVIRYLITARHNNQWSSTLDTAMVLRAITLTMLRSNDETVSETYKLLLNNRELAKGELTKEDLFNLIVKTIPVSDLQIGKENQVAISKSGTGNLYYNINLRYFLPFTEVKPLDQGMVIIREIVDGEGRLLTQNAIDENTEVWERLTVVAPEERHFVVIEDILPAGLESVNESLSNVAALNNSAPKLQKGTQDMYFTHKEYHDDRTTIFADYLPAGVYEVSYRIRATTPGKYHRPPAQAYQMYIPDVSGHSSGGWFSVNAEE